MPQVDPATAAAASSDALATSNERYVAIQNQHPTTLVVSDGDANVLRLAPLERTKPLSREKLEAMFNLNALEQRNYIRVLPIENTALPESIVGVGGMLGFGAFILYSVIAEGHPGWRAYYWVTSLAVIAIVMLGIVLWSKKRVDVALGVLWQVTTLLLVVGISIGMPLYALWLSGVDVSSGGARLFRGLQLVFISTASLLPALLYFLFDRQQLGTLRDRFEQQIFRLDPYVKTLVDVRAKYGRQIAEAFGSESVDAARLLRGTRWPIFVATLALTVGWITTLLPSGPGAPASERALNSLFAPHLDVLTFGFLGAYFFAVNTALRRYARGDLRPKAYSGITVRIFTVFILSSVLWLVLDTTPTTALLAAFLTGIVPETGLTFVQESIRSLGSAYLQSLQERHPLTDLEGIDLYDRARLEDEGITNIEGLAHHDLIDLMIETRIPVPRLVDWIDQAILYLHTSDAVLRGKMRDYGIRTATDLERADQAGLRGALDDVMRARVAIILSTLADDEWLAHVRSWRDSQPSSVDLLEVSAPAGSKQVDESLPRSLQAHATVGLGA
jgi:hypothetical protein